MNAHTPTPWFAVNDGSDDEPMWSIKAARIAGRPPRHEVAICATGDSPQEMETANAAFIVRAVNSHDALVNALSDVRASVQRAYEIGGDDTRANASTHLFIIDAALKLAGAL